VLVTGTVDHGAPSRKGPERFINPYKMGANQLFCLSVATAKCYR